MNGHIQDFADKLNRKEENKNKQTKKNEHSNSCATSYRMIHAIAKDFKHFTVVLHSYIFTGENNVQLARKEFNISFFFVGKMTY